MLKFLAKLTKKTEILPSQMYQIQEARRTTMDNGILARKEKEVTLAYNEALKLKESMLR